MAVITETRYGGVYEGGPWAAFAVDDPRSVPEDAFGGDPSAAEWWASPTVPVGAGDTPNDALERLRFLVHRDQLQEESGFFKIGDRVRCANSTPDGWYGEGTGIIRTAEFHKILPFAGGLRGQCVYVVEFEGSDAVVVPEPFLRREVS